MNTMDDVLARRRQSLVRVLEFSSVYIVNLYVYVCRNNITCWCVRARVIACYIHVGEGTGCRRVGLLHGVKNKFEYLICA